MKIRYAVWYIPTKKGMKAFGWQPKLINIYDNKDDADEDAYMSGIDEPAPDKHEYEGYHVIKYQQHTEPHPYHCVKCGENLVEATLGIITCPKCGTEYLPTSAAMNLDEHSLTWVD